MLRSVFASIAAALVLSAASTAAHAQMPVDNDTWRARCTALSDFTADLSHLTPGVMAMTRGVEGSKFQTFAFDRQAAGQHNVACALFFLAAIANQSARDEVGARDAALMAVLEVKGMRNQSVSFSESLTRTKVKAIEIRRPVLTIPDEEKIMLAATTIPFVRATAKPVSFQASGLLKH